MPTAANRKYWDWLALEHPECVCGVERQCLHHIIHVNGQRITKDDMLVIGLCAACHQGKGGVHDLGGDGKFHKATGWNLVELACLRRHNYEIGAR